MLPRFNIGDRVVRSTSRDDRLRFTGIVSAIIHPDEIDEVLSIEYSMPYNESVSAFDGRDPDWRNNYMYAISRPENKPMSYEEAVQVLPDLTREKYDHIMGNVPVAWIVLDSDIIEAQDEEDEQD